jgi:hypothetical protein
MEKNVKVLEQMGKDFDREFGTPAPQPEQQQVPQPKPKQQESSRASRLANLTLEDMMA